MNTSIKCLLLVELICAFTANARLAVTVAPPKIVGQKVMVELKMKNDFAEKVESARAICFLLDEQGKMVGESARWVIGGGKNRPALEAKREATFNLIIASHHPFTTTNLTAKVSFSRLILEDGKLGNPNKDITIDGQLSSANQTAPTNNPNNSKALDAVIAAASTSSPITFKHAARTPESIAVTNQMRPLKPQSH